MTLDDLPAIGRHDVGSFRGVPVVAHEDDRWIIPAVAAASGSARLGLPVQLVSLDRHHDACVLRKGLGEIPRVRGAGLPDADLLRVVDSHLSSNDDDWIKAGMELGVFGDVIVWGVDPNGPSFDDEAEYRDHLGQPHKLFVECSLPDGQLEFQGSLCDAVRRDELEPYWDALGWEVSSRRLGFNDLRHQLVVNIDLDCFAISWQGFTLPWPEEVWEARFNSPSTYSGTKGMTGGNVLRALVGRASLITIARELGYTGGREKGRRIYDELKHYLFEDAATLPVYPES
jgi:hypothetical protein